MRKDGRKNNQMRPIVIKKNFFKHAEGSCVISFGETQVACAASIEESVPSFLKGKAQGWVTAEYGMLPRSCHQRINREKSGASGRTQEIQRLIGRSLRAIVDLKKLGERTIKVDCDVLQGDGGTRTASITGGYVALALAIQKLKKAKKIAQCPLTGQIAAVSVGMVQKTSVLDLNYDEDSQADVDMNIVMLKNGNFVEIQGTAEHQAFSKKEMDAMLGLAQKGLKQIFTIQQKALS